MSIDPSSAGGPHQYRDHTGPWAGAFHPGGAPAAAAPAGQAAGGPPAPSTPAAPGPGGNSGAPTISPALWEQIHGRVIFDSAWCPVTEGQNGGFSVMGNRRLVITDLPAVHVYDTGGLGHANLARLAPAVDPSATVELIDQSTRLAVDLRFPDGRAFRATTIGPLPPDVLRLLVAGLHGRLLLDAVAASFVSPCAVSVLPNFEQDQDSTTNAQPARASATEPAKPTSVLAKLARQLDVKSGAPQGRAGAPTPTAGGPPPPPPTAANPTTGHGLPPGWTEAPTLIPPPPTGLPMAGGPVPAGPIPGAAVSGAAVPGQPPAAPAGTPLPTPPPTPPPVPVGAPAPAGAPAGGPAATPSAGGAAQGEATAYVVVRDGRLELRSRGQTMVDWPLNRVAVSPAGPASAFVRGGAVVNGLFLTGVLLHLATPEVLAAFLAVTQAGQAGAAEETTIGTSAPVWARGLRGRGVKPVRADCVLGDSVLELQARDGDAAVLARFDLADSRLRVAGSAQLFVIFDPDHGPVTVASDSEVFGRRLHAHPGVRAAAERTLAAGGPYPAMLADGQPVACAVAAGQLWVRGSGVNVRMPFPAIRLVEGSSTAERAQLRVAAAGPAGLSGVGAASATTTTDAPGPAGPGGVDITVVGQLELIRALHTDLLAGNYATEDPRHLPDMLRAAVGLEDDYFLYTIFGPFYELHAALLGDVTAADLGRPVTLPDDDEARGRTAAALAEGLGELQRHLDQVSSVLPAFVRHRDATLLAAAAPADASQRVGEPAWLKAHEGRLRAALAPAQRAAAETAALAAQVTRLLDLDPSALPKPNYAGAAISLGAALLNPVFLVSGATQIYSQYAQSEKRSAAISAQAARGWESVLDRWNTLVGSTLPVLGYVLTENLFAPRWDTARQLTKELRGTPPDRRPAVLAAVARRLARLDVLRRYPANAGIRLSRGEIAEHLRTARDSVSAPRFVDF